MKKYFLLLLILPAAICSQRFFATESTPEENESLAPDEWLYAQKVFPYDRVDKEAQRNAVNYTKSLKQKNRLAKTDGTRADDWEFMGPLTIGGRIADIECPAGNDNTIYVGTASGGVLKSYNGGTTWMNIFDDNGSLSIGDIAIDPVDTNTIYVGTGEGGNGVGSVTYDGDGIYKSTDGGATWVNTGVENGGNTGRLAINPQNTQIVFAAMLGDLFQNTSDRGVYRTTDGGGSWEKVLFIDDSTGAIDVAINPDEPNIVYATTWQRVRRYYRKDYTGFSSRIYRSNDGGDTWEMIMSGIPNEEFAKITLAIAPTNPDIIYAAVCGSTEALKDIYKSTNGGDSWVGLNCAAEVDANTQDCWYYGVKVNPNDPNKIYWIGFQCFRSLNGGNTWNKFAGTAHVDEQAFYISPTNDNYKIIGTDGGLYFTNDDWATYTTAQNIPVTQLYTIDMYPGDTSLLIGGAQDNGSFIKDGTDPWYYVGGGDGVSTRFVPSDELSYYANYQYGGYGGSINGSSPMFFGYDWGDRHNWRSPLELNPLNPATIYFGGSKVQRTNNYGNNLTTISSDLSNGSQGIGLTFGTIFTIHNAPADTNYIYVGTDDANVWRSKDYGENWELITSGLPYRYCMSIETDPNDAEIVYVAFSGFRWADDIAHIYKSENAGDSWTPISGDMPDIPVNDIQIAKYPGDTTTLIVGTDVGCYYSFNDGINWNLLGSELPIASVYEIYYDGPTNTLFAGTYGRGAWKISVPIQEPPVIQSIEDKNISFDIFPNPATDYLIIECSEIMKQAIVEIYNGVGEKVKEFNISGTDKSSIKINQLPAGNYFLQINNAGKKLTKQFNVL